MSRINSDKNDFFYSGKTNAKGNSSSSYLFSKFMGFITKSKSSYSNEVYPNPSSNYDIDLSTVFTSLTDLVITWQV